MNVGVLALQGSVQEHVQALSLCKVQPILVKTSQDLDKIAGLIIPGGESTTIGKLLNWYGLDQIIKNKVKNGLPVYGTCAGAILLAKKITGSHQVDSLKLIDMEIERNAYGSQLDSFSVDLSIPVLGKNSFPAVFIRAPKIHQTGKKVTILAKYNQEIVFAKQGNILVSMFHPELTPDLRLHLYFLNLAQQYGRNHQKTA